MASFTYDDSDSPRDTELSSLIAIYPEIQHPRPDDPYTIAIDIPVNPSKPVLVYFPAAADPNTDPRAQANAQKNGVNRVNGVVNGGLANGAGAGPAAGAGAGGLDGHEVAHLPPVHLEVFFGPEYPDEKPPVVKITADPPWLSKETIKRLEDDGPRLWEEMGRDMVGFTYIDHIQQAAENVFELVDEKGTLEVDPQHRIAIMDYDIRARRAAFEKETFNCGVCLDPKKGNVCHKMIDCGHVFCVECLQDFYNNAIKEGNLASVRCLAPNCAKEREQATASSSETKKRKKPKTYLSPSELLQIPLDQETVKRYVTLKYKTELESDKNTIYCPRQWCNGAARSKKHKKPQGLELNDEDDEDDEEEENSGSSKSYNASELLAICEDCNFAFCSRCNQSWHGEFVRCQAPRKNEELTAEEIASLEYMKLHTTPCPTCAAPAQKTHGCNHMICYRCQTHFCYLCSAWLDPGNPYQHFNEMPGGRITGCYQRLWELEQGDGDDVGLGFEGGNGAAPAAAARGAAAPPPAPAPAGVPLGLEGLPEEQIMEILMADMEFETDDEGDGHGAAPPAGGPQVNGRQNQERAAQGPGAGRGADEVAIAREGPLVLRIDGGGARGGGNQPAAGRGGRGGAAAPAAAPNGQAAGGGGGRGGGRGRGDHARGVQGHGPVGGANIRGQHQNRGGAPNNRHNNRNNNHQNQNGGVGAGAARGGRGRGGNGGAAGGNVVRGNVGGRARPNPNGPRMDFDNPNNPDNVQVNVPDGIRLDPQQEAWIRQFVHLALEDQEDLLFDDDDW
ncbi:RWD domain-containing protein [Sordaria brevicollis]|uniref:RBR-type E3 ubiquitin transferase n=1 Tax=Sordaria brevicollis TaxID=83679 RepID=A0AAE0PP58_SORBR|nr:RWD domain-containing protein [Sordaria brevicollis]